LITSNLIDDAKATTEAITKTITEARTMPLRHDQTPRAESQEQSSPELHYKSIWLAPGYQTHFIYSDTTELHGEDNGGGVLESEYS
jgi:hypothetical protein